MYGMIRVFKTKIYVSPFALILMTALAFSKDALLLYMVLGSACIHEAAHILCIKLLGAEIQRVSIYPFGADMQMESSCLSYKKEVWVALSGPFASLFAAIVSSIFLSWFSNVYMLFLQIANFAFFAVNILPVRGLDGGRALLCLLLSKLEFSSAYKIYMIVSSAAFGILCVLSIFVLYATKYNLSLVFMCAYLFVAQYSREKVCV